MKKSLENIMSKESIENASFNNYQLGVSLNLIKVFLIILGVFNLLLVIPDAMSLDNPTAKLTAIILRIVFTLMVIAFVVWISKIKSYKVLSLVTTIYELVAVFMFLYIFQLYSSPDFMIQLLGVTTIIIAVFLIPNIWVNKLIVANIIALGFLICSYFMFVIYPTQFIAGVVYIFIEIVLCAIFASYFDRYQRGEYIAKTELQRIYSTDPLTQVGNRIKLEDEADKWIEFCSRHGLNLSLVLVDIDNLKQINDQYGHLVGDVILYEMAQIMFTQLRKNDVCVRWGGDEFILLLPYTSVDEGKVLCERIRLAISEHEFNIEIYITCSFGISGMNKGCNLEHLIQQADVSMYAAKKHGKNNIQINGQLVSEKEE